MRRSRNNNNRNVERASSSSKSGRSSLLRLSRGERLLSVSRPVEFIPQPWNSATIRIVETVATATTYDGHAIVKTAVIQLGLTVPVSPTSVSLPMEFRILSLSCWNITDNTSHAGMLTMYPIDFLTDTGSELTQITVSAAKNAYASCGYVFPVTHQNLIFSSNVTQSVSPSRSIVTIDPTDGACIETRVQLLWRSATSTSLPNQSDMFRLNETMTKVCHALTKLGVEPSNLEGISSPTGSASFDDILRDTSQNLRDT